MDDIIFHKNKKINKRKTKMMHAAKIAKKNFGYESSFGYLHLLDEDINLAK